jgi:hypothetical protein
VTWTVVTAPVFDNCVNGNTALGCNPTPPTCATDITAHNECGPVQVVCSAGDIIENGFNRSQTFTYTAAGTCGLSSTCERTFTWFVSQPFTCLDPVSTTVLCGVTKVKAQENTDAEFLGWLNSFTYDSNLYTLGISYAYDSGTVKSDNGDGPKNPNAFDTAKVTVTWTLTNIETGCKESCSSTFSIENGCRVSCSYSKTDVLCLGEETGTITVTAGGGVLPYIIELFADGNPVAIASQTGGDTDEPFMATFENLGAGLYSYEVTDDYGRICSNDGLIEIGKGVPCGAHCTYTQGYYGNLGGISCADGVSYSTTGLISKALSSYPLGTMTIGLPGKSVLLSNTTADINAIVQVLPGGGSSIVLLAGNPHVSALPASYLKKGNINNTLLAQTITLGLNLGIDSELGAFGLQVGTLATAAPEGGCGSKIPKTRSCSEGGYTPVINEYKYFVIPAVVGLLPTPTVQGLFDMANTALGGGALPAGITLSDLAIAVDRINNAFDACRISMGYNQTPLTDCNTADKAAFEAYDVPITDQLTIKYKFSYTSNVRIDVYNMSGTLVHSQTDTNSYLDKEVKLNFNFNSGTGTQQVYFVKLTTNLGNTKKQVLSSN